jgi:hypothetical protein
MKKIRSVVTRHLSISPDTNNSLLVICGYHFVLLVNPDQPFMWKTDLAISDFCQANPDLQAPIFFI